MRNPNYQDPTNHVLYAVERPDAVARRIAKHARGVMKGAPEADGPDVECEALAQNETLVRCTEVQMYRLVHAYGAMVREYGYSPNMCSHFVTVVWGVRGA